MFTVNILTIFLNVKLSCKGKQITDINSIFVTSAEKLCNEFSTKISRNCASGRGIYLFRKSLVLFLVKCLFNKMARGYLLFVVTWTFSIIKYVVSLLWSIRSSGLGHHNLTLAFEVIFVGPFLGMGYISLILKVPLI